MKLYLVHRNDSVDYDEYGSAIVVAESPEDAIQMLKTSLEEKYGEGEEEMWGNFDVTVKEVDLNEPKIILQIRLILICSNMPLAFPMLCGG